MMQKDEWITLMNNFSSVHLLVTKKIENIYSHAALQQMDIKLKLKSVTLIKTVEWATPYDHFSYNSSNGTIVFWLISWFFKLT